MKKLLLIICAAAALLFVSCKGEQIKLDGLTFTVPSGAQFQTNDSGNPLIENGVVLKDKSMVLVSIYKEEMNPDAALRLVATMIPTLGIDGLSEAQYGEVKQTKFKNLDASQIDIHTTVDHAPATGKVLFVSANHYTFLFITLSTDGDEMEKSMFESMEFTPNNYVERPIEDKMKENVASTKTTLPITIADDLSIIDIQYDNNTVSYTYRVENETDLNAEQTALFIQTVKTTTIDGIIELNSKLVADWLAAGKSLSYRYTEINGNEIGSFTVKKEDLHTAVAK